MTLVLDGRDAVLISSNRRRTLTLSTTSGGVIVRLALIAPSTQYIASLQVKETYGGGGGGGGCDLGMKWEP